MAQKNSNRIRTRREDDEIEKSYRKYTATKGKYQKKKHKFSKKQSDAITFSVTILVIVALIGVLFLMYNADKNGIIPENITVAGINVGGMTRAEAVKAVKIATKNTYSQKTMIVNVIDSQVEIEPELSKASLNVNAAVRAAMRSKPGETVDLSRYLNLDETAIKRVLNSLGELYSSTLSQSTYEVTGSAPNQILVVQLGVPEYGLDVDALYRQVLDAYSENTFKVDGKCGLIPPNPLDLQAILDKYYIAPVNASFDKKTFAIVDGKEGYGFDIKNAEKKLSEATYGSTVKIPFTNIKPDITAESLTATLYKDILATYTATDDSESNRDTNLRLACEAINGMVINPGDVFSYNQALGERTSAKGYKPGPSFVNGKTVETIGGGICQVSSCLYYCAMLADLEIRVRENHGFAVTYVPLGMDAAVSWGSLDFCFKNNTSYPIRIEATASGGSTTISLVGTDEKDYYVEMEYEVLATYSYDTSYQTMSPNNSGGYKNGDYIVSPHTGYSVQTYRCKYQKDTKELISKNKEDKSSYNKCDAVICMISGSGNGSSSGIGNGNVTDGDGILP